MAEGLDLGIDGGFGLLEGIAAGLVGDRHIDHLGGGEEGLEPVVVGRRDRVELVVVAAGAADGQAEEDRADGPGDLGQLRLPLHRRVEVAGDNLARTAAAEAGGDQGLGIAGAQLVPGELEGEELVVGQVVVEGLDHPIAIAPGVGPFGVEFEAVGVGVVGQIEPVLRPSLAVGGAVEEAVDDPFVCIGEIVVQEGPDLLGGRRQAGEVERGAADQADAVELGGVLEFQGLHLGEDEPIDRIARPGCLGRLGRYGMADRLIGPMVALILVEGLGRGDRGIVGSLIGERCSGQGQPEDQEQGNVPSPGVAGGAHGPPPAVGEGRGAFGAEQSAAADRVRSRRV